MRTLANRLLSLLLGAALLAAGLTTIVDGLRVAADKPTWILDGDRLYADGRTTLLGDGVVLATCVLLALAGLALLVLQLWPRAAALMPINAPVGEGGAAWADDADPADQRWWIARRTGERRLGRIVLAGLEVERVSVKLRRRRRGWRALVEVTPPQDARADATGDPVTARVQAELDALAAAGVTVSTRVHAPRRPRD